MESIVLATGGTGGHIFPAIAVAEEIKARNPKCLIVFLGSIYGPEAEIVTKAGFKFIGLPVRGVVGRGLKGFFSLFGLIGGVVKSLGILRKVKPQFVIGFGGYAAFAGVMAAWLRGTPCGIHEQNAFPGKANRLLGKLVSRVFLSFPVEEGFFQKKTLFVGNPVRLSIKQVGVEKNTLSYEEKEVMADEKNLRDKSHAPRLLVLGGSLGSLPLNEGMVEGIRPILDAGIEVWHQAGANAYAQVKAGYQKAGAETVKVEAFIDDMKAAYLWADLALCRAGGSTIAELTVAGVPSILVPFPFATHDHQLHNARCLDRIGAAVLLEQKEFYGPNGDNRKLVDTIIRLASDKERLRLMRKQCFEYAKPDAAANIVDEIDVLLSLAMLEA